MKKILFVDRDNQGRLSSAVSLLSDIPGLSVTPAASLENALAILKERTQPFDLILIRKNIPSNPHGNFEDEYAMRDNGFKLISAIKNSTELAQHKDTKTVLMTYALSFDGEESLSYQRLMGNRKKIDPELDCISPEIGEIVRYLIDAFNLELPGNTVLARLVASAKKQNPTRLVK